MQRLNSYLIILGLACSISISCFAYEAPVVSAEPQQYDDTVSTHAVTSSGGWQPVESNNSNDEWQSSSSRLQEPASTSSNESNYSNSVSQRVNRLEQQVTNYNQMNLPQQVSDLEQKNARLQGQLELAQHNLKDLTEKQKAYYQDLEQQIADLKAKEQAESHNTQSTSPATIQTSSGEMQPATVSQQVSQSNDSISSSIVPKSVSPISSSSAITTQSSEPDVTKPQQVDLLHPKPTPSLGDADAYQKAFRLLSNKHFEQSKASFNDYLVNYPNGRFAVNAYFWLGEIAMMNQHFNTALKEFQTVVSNYPNSDKVPDSKLKIAMINAASGKTELARTQFNEIRKAYPGSTAAQLATIRLQQLATVM